MAMFGRKRKQKAANEKPKGGPIVRHGPEQRNRAARRAGGNRLAAIERALIAKGVLTKEEIDHEMRAG
ncbi:MAG: hypothetical protein KIT65_11010 [Xanthobacteraceae bacterium]|nr:hypothetical protein [Xanthobacteraceae bacterium]